MSQKSRQPQSPMDMLNEYIVPVAVCGVAMVAAIIYFKNSMAIEPLAPAPVEKTKKKKEKKVKAKAKPVEKRPETPEESGSSDVEVVEAKTTKKTGAQKRREKKEREAAALQADAPKKPAPSKAKPAKKAAPEPKPTPKPAPKPAPVDDNVWETVEEPVKKGTKAVAKVSTAEPAEAAKKDVKKDVKKAKERSAKQKATAKPDDYLKNLPEEVQAQLRRFNNYDGGDSPASPAKSNNATSDDSWAKVPDKVQPTKKSAPVVAEHDYTIEVAPVVPTYIPKVVERKVIIYEAADCWADQKSQEKGDKEVSKTQFSGLAAVW